VVTKGEVKRLHYLLEEIGEPCRTLLLKWGAGGYSMKEIAEISGLESADQAKKKKYYCLKKLMKKISHNKYSINV